MMKKDRILSLLTLISGIFVIFCYGVNLLKTIILVSGITEFLLSAAVIAAAALAIAFRDKAWLWLRALLCFGMCFYMVTFIAFLGWIGLYQTEELPEDSSFVVMVFGCRTYGMNPGRTLARRLDSALALLEEHPLAVCIVSGGQGSNETVPEAAAMAGYLTARGIDPARIVQEPESHNTVENLRFSAEIIREKGWEELPVVGVSSAFHIPRIMMLADRQDIEMTAVGSPSANIFLYFADTVREYMAWVKALILN